MPLVAKVTLGRDTRRIYFEGEDESSLCWSTLRKRIFEVFKSNVADPSLFTVTYKDDEDDQVTLTSDAEMSELLNYHTNLKNGTKFLYLTIVPRKDNSTPVYVDYRPPKNAPLSDSQYLEKIRASKNSKKSPYNEQKTSDAPSRVSGSELTLTPTPQHDTEPQTSYDSDCSLRATYASDDDSVTSTPPDSPPFHRAADPLRKCPQKVTLEKPQPQRTTFESTNQPPRRPPFRHPVRPARAPFNPKRRPHTPRPTEEYTELKQLAQNLPQTPPNEEKTTINQPRPQTTQNQQTNPKPETRSIGCQTDSVLVIPRESLENLSGELGQLLIKEMRSSGLLAPTQERENFMNHSWGPIVGEAGNCDLSRSDIPPQASDGPQVAIPDGFSHPLASSQMMDDMSRSIADISEELRLLRQSLVMGDGQMPCPPSEGSCFSSTRSSTNSFGHSTESDPTPYRESDYATSSNTEEGSPVTQKEGEGSTPQYSSFDFHCSSETPHSEPNPANDTSQPTNPQNDVNEPTNPSESQPEVEGGDDVNESSKDAQDVPVRGEISESNSHAHEMFQSADDLSRFRKDLRNGPDSQSVKDSANIDDLLKELSDMGFPNSVFNKVLLQQNHCDLSQTISDLKSFYSKSSGSI